MKRPRSKMWKPFSDGILGDVIGYVSGRGIGLVLAAITSIVVARYLGPSNLGLLGFAVSIYALVIPFSLLGMRQVLIREFSTTNDWQPILSSALSRQIPTAIAASIVSFVIIVLAREGDQTAVLVAIALLPLPILATKDTIQALHEAAGHMRVVVASALVATIAASAAKIGAVIAGAPVWVFAFATTLEAILLLVALLVGHWRTLGPLRAFARIDSARARGLVRESWPLLIGALAVTIYMRIDIAMLGLLAGDEETGVYVAAARISEIWYFIPVAAMAAVRPRLSSHFGTGDMARYNKETQQFLSAAWVLSLVAVLMTLVFAGALVLFLFGSAFAGATPVLRIHILAAPFVFLGVGASQWFVDRGLTKAVMVRSVTGMATNIGINLVLIPLYGAAGAATATLVSYAVSGVLMNAFSAQTRGIFMMQIRALLGTRK